jgi:hypothetical protein
MLLYKYVSFSSAIKIINGNAIGFTCLEDLNDPFEGTNFGFSALGSITPQSATTVFKNNFSRKYALLSLTRNPLNSLMWSHYGDAHKGVVIGIDTEVAGLTSQDEFTIPAQLGEITYIATKSNVLNDIPSIMQLNKIRKDDLKFSSDIKNYLKQAFLYKSLEWGYEEEVRIIKSLTRFKFSYHGNDAEVLSQVEGSLWEKVRNSSLGQPLFCFGIPANAIKEVYLGASFNRNASRSNEGEKKQWCNEQLEFLKAQNFKLYACDPDYSGWKLSARLLSS